MFLILSFNLYKKSSVNFYTIQSQNSSLFYSTSKRGSQKKVADRLEIRKTKFFIYNFFIRNIYYILIITVN